ncbi:hypothetical protein ACFC5T_40180 [Streptomyces sp. NPDC055961]|uniref:hypothetical protein n=1 Tax=Streptomyces sp. NPDC055961 TaxID=3345666 RepID=UPI0035D601DA
MRTEPENRFDEYHWEEEPPELAELLGIYDDLVPYSQAMPGEVREAVAPALAALAGASAAAVGAGEARQEPSATPEQAEAVNAALEKVDQQSGGFRDSPEWQRIQTIRGALGHVWDVLKEKAGPYWDTLRQDVRFEGWWKTIAIRAASAIGRAANSLANRIRQSTAGELPSTDALMKLSDTVLAYSNPSSAPVPSSGQPSGPPAVAEGAVVAARSARISPLLPYADRDEAVMATKEVSEAFQRWAGTAMGQELITADHPRVEAFRTAWQRLPSLTLETGTGPAAGPYADVAERARGLAEAAAASGRFAPGDVAALRLVAAAAGTHGARLAVTLPETAAQTPAVRAAAQAAPTVATCTPAQSRGPRVSV